VNGVAGGVGLPAPAMETQAVASLIARSFGLDAWPLPDNGRAPLIGVDAAAEVLANGVSFSPPAKLELLAHLSRQHLPVSVLSAIAESLVQPTVIRPGFDVVRMLLDRVSDSRPGEDALGRNESEPPLAGDVLVGHLLPEIELARVRVSETCSERSKVIKGYLSLSIATEIDIPESLEAVRPMADPREWPRCPIQADFFKSMEEVTPLQSLKSPYVGWSATLREVVDFSFGMERSGSSLMETDLMFTFTEDARSITCTYDLAESRDGKILVDQGHVIIQDLEGPGVRIRTLKEVAFATRPHPGDVCQPWSRAHAAAASSCLSTTHPVQGSDS